MDGLPAMSSVTVPLARTCVGPSVISATFSTPEELREAVIQGLHELALARTSGPVSEAELADRARRLIPSVRSFSFSRLILLVVGGPTQQVLRPAELESRDLETEVQREALTGTFAVLDVAELVAAAIPDVPVDRLVRKKKDQASA